jgi:hypothetical protein
VKRYAARPRRSSKRSASRLPQSAKRPEVACLTWGRSQGRPSFSPSGGIR